MKKNSGSMRYSGSHTSPGTPEYGDLNAGKIASSWSSERIPLPGNNNRRNMNNTSASLMPFNIGRALPSKWDDAERWITSPISGDTSVRKSVTQTRPKSKSGPLGPPGYVYWSHYSPNLNVVEGANSRKFMANSEGSVSVVAAELKYDDSVPCFQDDKLNGFKYEEMVAPRDGYCRDAATQMSKQGSACSCSSSSSSSNGNSKITLAAKDEIRDVQVDKGITDGRSANKETANVVGLPLPWSGSHLSRNTSWLQREEAKITAWENLQKAKAEAAIRKLEVWLTTQNIQSSESLNNLMSYIGVHQMNLEKKKSVSTERILTKLRDAHMKAQVMRNSLSENRAPRDRRISNAAVSCFICIKWRRNL